MTNKRARKQGTKNDWIELLLTAVALSMDAFAVATCKGLNLRVMNWKRAGIIDFSFSADFRRLCRFLAGCSASSLST